MAAHQFVTGKVTGKPVRRCRSAAWARSRWTTTRGRHAEPFTYDAGNVDKFAKFF